MKIEVKYFAMLRESMGCEGESVEVPAEVQTVGELKNWLAARDEVHAAAFAGVKRLRAAMNGMMVQPSAKLEEGAEVAYFPPVTGG